jgi:hypothetical protein
VTDEVFDLDALEAEGEPFTFRHNGQDYTMPADIDLTTVAVLGAGDFERAMERLLGDDVWQGIVESSKAKGAKPFGVKKMLALLEAYAKHLGVGGLGGFSASTAS